MQALTSAVSTSPVARVASAAPVTIHDGASAPARGAKKRLWTGRALSGLALAFLTFDCAMKVFELAPAVEGTTALGYPSGSVFTIGLLQLSCLVLYAVPRTAALGAIFLTGYLGGAIATHVRVENPLFSHVLFPVYIAALVWGGLYLRDARLRVLLPSRRSES